MSGPGGGPAGGTTPTRVVVVDDDGDLRLLVRLVLEQRPGYEVVGEASDGRSALDVVAREAPDLVVLDVGLPDVPGFDLLPRLHALAEGLRIVVFTGAAPAEAADYARRLGAAGYVRKQDDITLLVQAIEAAAAGAVPESTCAFEASPAAVRGCRRFVEARCRDLAVEHLADTAMLVVSELVTNAVVHAESAGELRVQMTEGLLRLEVLDHGEGAPDPQRASDEDEGGRGLLLVSSLSHAWGIDPAADTGYRKKVWVELAV